VPQFATRQNQNNAIYRWVAQAAEILAVCARQIPIVKPNPEERPPRVGEPQTQNLEARRRRAWRWPKPLALNPDSTSDVPKKLRGLPAPQLQDYPNLPASAVNCAYRKSPLARKKDRMTMTMLHALFPSSHVDMDVADF